MRKFKKLIMTKKDSELFRFEYKKAYTTIPFKEDELDGHTKKTVLRVLRLFYYGSKLLGKKASMSISEKVYHECGIKLYMKEPLEYQINN